jgi:hypothetical protein
VNCLSLAIGTFQFADFSLSESFLQSVLGILTFSESRRNINFLTLKLATSQIERQFSKTHTKASQKKERHTPHTFFSTDFAKRDFYGCAMTITGIEEKLFHREFQLQQTIESNDNE